MLCIFFNNPHVCPCWILCPWCNYLCLFVLVVCWTCKWYFALSLFACMSKCSSLCEWSLWSLFIVIVLVWSSHTLLLYSLLLDRIVLVLYAFQDFCLQWSSCVIVFRKTCLYGSRAPQFLELGVSELWQLFPTHILSLESVLGFCHGIAKGGDCKVEFIQSCVAFISCQICLYFSN